MTHTDYAGVRLANAVQLWLRDRDPSALAGMKIALSEYREAERKHAAAIAANDLQDDDQ